MAGYYKVRGEAIDAFDEERWLRTGDLGILENGFLRYLAENCLIIRIPLQPCLFSVITVERAVYSSYPEAGRSRMWDGRGKGRIDANPVRRTAAIPARIRPHGRRQSHIDRTMKPETDKNGIIIYDTTLRDGAQTFGISFSLHDKIRIAREIDRLKIDYIEGGWPGSNPKDDIFFSEIRKTDISHARIAAFGSTRRPRTKVKDDQFLQALAGSGADTITIVAKTWDFHVTGALGITPRRTLNSSPIRWPI